jgi:hypothetical protein
LDAATSRLSRPLGGRYRRTIGDRPTGLGCRTGGLRSGCDSH